MFTPSTETASARLTLVCLRFSGGVGILIGRRATDAARTDGVNVSPFARSPSRHWVAVNEGRVWFDVFTQDSRLCVVAHSLLDAFLLGWIFRNHPNVCAPLSARLQQYFQDSSLITVAFVLPIGLEGALTLLASCWETGYSPSTNVLMACNDLEYEAYQSACYVLGLPVRSKEKSWTQQSL